MKTLLLSLVGLLAALMLVGAAGLVSFGAGSDASASEEAPLAEPVLPVQQTSQIGASFIEGLIEALEQLIEDLRAHLLRAMTPEETDTAESSGSDEDGCTTEHESGPGWSSTSVVCVQRSVTENGQSQSVSITTNVSSSN